MKEEEGRAREKGKRNEGEKKKVELEKDEQNLLSKVGRGTGVPKGQRKGNIKRRKREEDG